MSDTSQTGNSAPTFLINRSSANDSYTVWEFNPSNPALVTQVPISSGATFPSSNHLCAVGGYLMAYSPLITGSDPNTDLDYRVFQFDPTLPDPLNGPALQTGQWKQSKFWGFYNHYTWDQGLDVLQLVPVTGYVLAYMPTSARGSYHLWNFDPVPTSPGAADPLPNAITPYDAFSLIGESSELHPIGNYVVEWMPSSSRYRVWSFDPQEMTPLALPAISEGTRGDMDGHRLLVIGEYILDWVPGTLAYRLWGFNAQTGDPFVGPVQTGTLPQGFNGSSILTSIQNSIPVNPIGATIPGTMDYMRDNIEHVVVYMLESRSMDSVLGWLYANNSTPINWVNADPPFKGTSFSYSNQGNGNTYNVYQFQNGMLGSSFDLNAPTIDPFHGTPDSIHQQFSGGYPAYFAGDPADMAGFVANNCSGEVMVTLTPTQLPVLNGLATDFAVSDYWFSALPGGTDSNRAFALTGSAYNITTTYEGNPQYEYFPTQARRQSIWKVLWDEGITDWKIYYSVLWINYVFTYQLYLKGDIPTVDANKDDYIQPLELFKNDAAAGTLPRFSFLEPAWIAPTGSTSYHPGGDLVPPERALNEIYEAIISGPKWDKTALIITFSKGGGLYDHESTPWTVNAWPHDVNDGFSYNVLGPRVPTIVVSPWVKSNTVFRSPGVTPLSATSLPATILDWFGVPRSRWGLGDRVPVSETFEAVFQCTQARTDRPSYTPPYDKTYPPPAEGRKK